MFDLDARLEWLLEQADRLWMAGKSLPHDLAAELKTFGVDVETLERKARQ